MQAGSQIVCKFAPNEVVQMRGDIKDGKVNRYQVTLKVGFTLE